MHKTLSRIAAVATSALLATVIPPSSTAFAATSNDCDPATSKQLVTGGLFGNTTDRLWVDHPTSTRTLVCFRFQSLGVGGITIVVDTALSGTLPGVIQGTDPASCPNVILTLINPVALRLAVSLANSTVCLTVGNTTNTVDFNQGSIGPNGLPVFEIWRDGGAQFGWIDVASCPAEWAVAATVGGPTTCLTSNTRIL